MDRYKPVFSPSSNKLMYMDLDISDIEDAVKQIAQNGRLFITFSNESGKKSEAFEVTGAILSQIAKSKAITSRIE